MRINSFDSSDDGDRERGTLFVMEIQNQILDGNTPHSDPDCSFHTVQK